MLTKQDKKYLNEILVTKKDFKKFATKEQLTQQALDIGTEFEQLRDEMGIRFDGIDKRFDGLENRFDGLESKLDQQHNLLNNLVRKWYKTLDRWDRQDEKTRDHEQRISQLEVNVGVAF